VHDLDDHLAGVTDSDVDADRAFLHLLDEVRDTSSATSAWSSARRTPRSAASTSRSDSAEPGQAVENAG
jgi:hypothetical protein